MICKGLRLFNAVSANDVAGVKECLQLGTSADSFHVSCQSLLSVIISHNFLLSILLFVSLSPFALKSIITIVSINDIPFVTISYYHYTNCYMSTATDFIDVIRARKKYESDSYGDDKCLSTYFNPLEYYIRSHHIVWNTIFLLISMSWLWSV